MMLLLGITSFENGYHTIKEFVFCIWQMLLQLAIAVGMQWLSWN
jgi:hypothetical protein